MAAHPSFSLAIHQLAKADRLIDQLTGWGCAPETTSVFLLAPSRGVAAQLRQWGAKVEVLTGTTASFFNQVWETSRRPILFLHGPWLDRLNELLTLWGSGNHPVAASWLGPKEERSYFDQAGWRWSRQPTGNPPLTLLNPHCFWLDPAPLKLWLPVLCEPRLHHPDLFAFDLSLALHKIGVAIRFASPLVRPHPTTWPSSPFTRADFVALGRLAGQLLPARQLGSFARATVADSLQAGPWRLAFWRGVGADTVARLTGQRRTVVSPFAVAAPVSRAQTVIPAQLIATSPEEYRQLHELPRVFLPAGQPLDEPFLDLYTSNPQQGEARLAARVTRARREKRETAVRYRELTARLKRPLKLKLVLSVLTTGGAEWTAWSYKKYLDPRFFDVALVVNEIHSPYGGWLAEQGLPVQQTPQDNRSLSDRLQESLRDADIVDNLFLHDWELWSALTEMGYRGPVISRLTNMRQPTFTPRMATTITDLFSLSQPVWQRAQAVVPKGIRNHQIYVGSTLEPPELTYPYYDHAAHRPLEPDKAALRRQLGLPNGQLLLWTGRMSSWEKNIPLLKKAIVATARRPVRWVVIGYWLPTDEVAARDWRQFCDEHGVTWLATLHNWQTLPYYQAADFIVSTSHLEGFSLAVLDGLRTGLPAIATDSGGVRELVFGGANGILTPANDTLFLDGLLAAIDAPASTYARWSQNARDLASKAFGESFVVQQNAVAYLEAYFRHHA